MIGKTLRKAVARLLLMAAVVLAAYAGWRWGDAVFPRGEEMLGMRRGADSAVSNEVTPAAAQAAEARIRAFRDSMEPELRLDSFEVSSLLRYSLPDLLPPGVIRPGVTMDADRIDIRASVLPQVLPELPDLGGIVEILPDTLLVLVRGSLSPFGDDGSMLLIRAIEVQGVPIPSPVFPDILAALGRQDARGLPESAVLVPAFGRIKGAYIENGQLVLVRA